MLPTLRLRETEIAFKENGCALRVCTVCELFFVHPYPEAGSTSKSTRANMQISNFSIARGAIKANVSTMNAICR